MTGSAGTMTGRTWWLAEGGLYLTAMAVVAAMGFANLFYPFGPDQALFFYGAQRLDHGATYYIDYWDNKQPAIYWFYLLAGRLFGFSEARIHMLELLWMLAFSAVLMVALRGAFKNRWLSAFVPVATVGVYYGFTGERELTQLEFIVAFPLFAMALCLLWAQRRPQRKAAFYFASGILAGVVATFKLLLTTLCLGLWLVALVYLLHVHRTPILSLVVRAILPATAGVALVLGGVVLLFASWGALDALLWTAFVYPPQALALAPPAPTSRLITAAAFFLSGTAPLVLFILFAIYTWNRNNRDLLGALMLTWLVMGIGLFFVQRFSWWYYHTLLFLLPAGVLAVMGIDRLCTWFDEENRLGVVRQTALTALLALCMTASLTDDFVRKARPMLSMIVMQGGDARAYQADVSKYYKMMIKSVHFLRAADALPGPVYVFGNTMMHILSERPSPHYTTGSAWNFFLPEQIDDILTTLERKKVPYVFVDRVDSSKLSRRQPRIVDYLETHYKRHHMDEAGQWYIRRAEP